MAILHIRNVPDILYERLKERAARERRSLSGQVVLLLEQAVDEPARDQDAALVAFARREAELRGRHAEVIRQRAMATPEDQAALLARITAHREALAATHGPFPDSVADLRADRNREE